MRICIVTPNLVLHDGQGRVNYEIVQEAIRRGYSVTVLAQQLESDLLHHPQVTWIRFSTISFPVQILSDLLFAFQSQQWLRINTHQFEVLQIDGAVTDFVCDVNVVHFVHSAWLKSPVHLSRTQKNLYGLYQWLYTSMNAYRERVAFSKAGSIIVVSDRVKQELLSLGVSENKISVIYNGVDINEFKLGQGDRIALKLPEGVPLALFIGDLKTNRKNLDTVLKALQHLPETHLVVVGNPQGSTYPEMARNFKIHDRVHFIGRRQDIPKVMQSCDFFVFPSRYEPFGMVITESMATGLPVIISKCSGASELATSSSSLVVDPEDTKALVDAMRILSIDINLRKRMGQAARQIAEQHTWRSKAASYINLLEERQTA